MFFLKMTMPVKRRLMIALSLLTAMCQGNELKDYCSMHKFDNLPPGGLRFTKEVVTTEYANIGAFKALHCCLRGYRSIEWYKDNRAYPWPGGESHFILYPESANQTIYAQKVRASDAGRYSCRARNDTTILEGDITLAVLGEKSGGYTGKPLPTYRPASQLVPLGGAARLFCEAYLGKVELPDAKNSVTWSKSDSNVTLPNHGRIAQHRVSRENNQIIGSYLEIEDITLEDYGEYKCEVSNGVDEEITLPAHVYRQEPQFALGLQNGSWRRSFLVGVLVLVLLISAGAFYARCWLPLVLLCRDKFAPLEENAFQCEYSTIVEIFQADSDPRRRKMFPTKANRYDVCKSQFQETFLFDKSARWKGMRRPGVLPREGLKPGHWYNDPDAGVEASVQVHGVGALPAESELGRGDRAARRFQSKSHRDPEPGVPRKRLERNERGDRPESAVVVDRANHSDRHQGSVQHERDRETIESGMQRQQRVLPRSFEDLALGRESRHIRLRQPEILVQVAARDAARSTDQLRERLPVGRHDRSGERKVWTAEGSVARKSRSSRLTLSTRLRL